MTRTRLPLLSIPLLLVAACGGGGGGGTIITNSGPETPALSTAAMETATRSGVLGLTSLVRAVVDAAQSSAPIPDTTPIRLRGDFYHVLAGGDGFPLLLGRPKGVRLASLDGLKWADVTVEGLVDGTVEVVGELKTGVDTKHKLILVGVEFTFDPRIPTFDPVGDAQGFHVTRYEGGRPIEEANGLAQFPGDGTVYVESTFRMILDGRETAFVAIAPLY